MKERESESRSREYNREGEGEREGVHLPIMRRQVSGLKWDQFPLVRACWSSVAEMAPLWSLSTATNHE